MNFSDLSMPETTLKNNLFIFTWEIYITFTVRNKENIKFSKIFILGVFDGTSNISNISDGAFVQK